MHCCINFLLISLDVISRWIPLTRHNSCVKCLPYYKCYFVPFSLTQWLRVCTLPHTLQVSKWNTKCNFESPPPLICSASPVISEGVLGQEANAVQFPELPATATCSHCQGHLQKGNFHLLRHFLSEPVLCAHTWLFIMVPAIELELKFAFLRKLEKT